MVCGPSAGRATLEGHVCDVDGLCAIHEEVEGLDSVPVGESEARNRAGVADGEVAVRRGVRKRGARLLLPGRAGLRGGAADTRAARYVTVNAPESSTTSMKQPLSVSRSVIVNVRPVTDVGGAVRRERERVHAASGSLVRAQQSSQGLMERESADVPSADRPNIWRRMSSPSAPRSQPLAVGVVTVALAVTEVSRTATTIGAILTSALLSLVLVTHVRRP